MGLINNNLEAFLVTSVLVVGSWLYFVLPQTLQSSPKQSQPHPGNPNTTTTLVQHQQAQLDWRRRARLINTLIVAANAIYVLYSLFVCAPHNVYTLLRAPLGASGDALRPALLRMTQGHGLDAELEGLLERLNDAKIRAVYARYGHDAVASCEYCSNFEDFMMYAFPGPFLEYVLEAFVVGFVTTRASGRDRWRKWGIGALVAAALKEVYIAMVFPIDAKSMTSFGPMLHDRQWFLRHTLFLILPPILHLLPSSPLPLNSNPLSALPHLTALLDLINTRVHLLKYVRGANSRAPELRENSSAWWRREHLEGKWAREDEGVKETAEKLGLGYEGERGVGGSRSGLSEGEGVGKLRANVRTAIQALALGFAPSEHTNI